ncbi:MAG TPA: hypothetical protein VFY90_03220 [Tepidiformaceae bacterium]|nr:hypothetical protein [Tepidiformaceae bacterium]
MRTIIDLTPEQLTGLERFRKRKGISRAAAVREAVDRLIQSEGAADLEDVFGAWTAEEAEKVRHVIAELRAEWDQE